MTYIPCTGSLTPLLKQMYELNPDKTAKPLKFKIPLVHIKDYDVSLKPNGCFQFDFSADFYGPVSIAFIVPTLLHAI